MSEALKTMFRLVVLECVARTPSAAPSTPEATAPQPGLRSPCETAQPPAAMASTPMTTGTTGGPP
jgi:hypothetical protein